MPSENSTLLDKNTVLLVSGGAKGITAQCAIKIAEAAACSFILVGRSAVLDPEPEWAAGITPAQLQTSALEYFKQQGKKVTPKELQNALRDIHSSREISDTLRRIAELGGKAVYISADVTDLNQLKAGVETAVRQLGPVTGIIHGAGNLADKLIENKSSRDFDLVVDTKIMGLRNILQTVQPQSLKFLVLFSSVAGFFGNSGQADYAIANEILNKSAHIIQKSLPDCHVVSINWGPWDSGMVSPELKKVFEQHGIRLIPTEAGIGALLDELTRGDAHTPQVVIGSPILADMDFPLPAGNAITIKRHLVLEDNPFLNDHRIGQQPVLPATCASAWLADTCQALHPGFAFVHMEDFKILKGITFENHASDYALELKPDPAATADEKIYNVLVTSQNGSGRKIFHYSGQVTLAKEIPPAAGHASIRAIKTDPRQVKNGADFYRDGTLFHGPAFQGVQEVMLIDDKTVITRVSLPPMSAQAQGQFPARVTNPFINDAIVQSLLIWTQTFYDAPCLPSRLHQWDHYRSIPFGMPVWVILEVTHHNEHAVVGNMSVQDEEGNEFFYYTGLEGTVSKHLKRFIGKNNAQD